jgi:diadenosine tetraphosphate (Ap4A) HIT family hydrolase
MLNGRTSPHCPFCDSNEFLDRHICDWGGVRLVSDAHPITFGHLLGVADEHILSFGQKEHEYLLRLSATILETSKLLIGNSPKIVLFERGNKSENISGRPSVDHAHFHLIPTNDITDLLPSSRRRASFLDLPRYIEECSYYFYWDVLDDVAYWGRSEEVCSQFIRKAVCLQNRLPEWNWRTCTQDNNEVREHSNLLRTQLKGLRDGT